MTPPLSTEARRRKNARDAAAAALLRQTQIRKQGGLAYDKDAALSRLRALLDIGSDTKDTE